MLKASIDIGTNSVRLLVADVNDNKKINNILKKVDVVRLGAGVDKERNLTHDAIDRAINQLKEYKEILNSYNINNVSIIATSAVRDANNKSFFLQKVKETLDWDINVVPGEKEAFLTYLGVKQAFSMDELIVFDIGGGSTEFIIGNKMNNLQIFSLNVGSVRMTERFIENYPINNSNYVQMKQNIEEILEPTFAQISSNLRNKTLIGVAGTVTTIAAVDQKLDPYDTEKIHKYTLYYDNVERIHNEIKTKTIEEIKQIKGIHPKRSDVILAGSLICLTIMNKFNFDKLMVSESELLEGIILDNL